MGNAWNTLFDGYVRFITSRPYPVLLVTLIVALICAAGIRHIGLSTDYRAFFDEGNPQLQAFDALQNIFSKNDTILFVIRPKEGGVFTAKTLFAIESLTKSAWQIPYSSRVDSLTNFQHTSAEGDDLRVADLVSGAAELTAEQLARIREIALGDPRLVHQVVAQDGRTTAVNVTMRLPGKSRSEVPEAVAYARALAADMIEANPGLDVRLTGNVLMSNAMSEASVSDIKTLMPLMYGVIILSVMLLLRSLLAAVLLLFVISLSTLSAIGLAGWLGMVITPPSASAPTIITTLGLASCIHVLITFLTAYNDKSSKSAAVGVSLRLNVEPIVLAALTTAIGFLCMNFSDTPPLRDLGNISAIGILAALAFTLFTLPALLMITPISNRGLGTLQKQVYESLGNFVVSRYRILVLLMGFLSAALIVLVPTLELNDQYVDYFDTSNSFRRDTDFAMTHLTGIYRIEYVMGAGESGGVSDPDYQKTLEAFKNWYRMQPEVDYVHSFSEIMKTLNKNMHGDDETEYRLPDSRNLAAQYLLLYEMSLPYGLDLNRDVSIGKDATRFNVVVKNISSKELLALESRAAQWLAENAKEYTRSEGTGSSIVFAHMSERSIRSMISGTLLAVILIGLILMLALRSFKYGLLSFFSNLLPALVAMGIWAVTVGEMGFALSVMIAMTLGIVVDDTIHLITKYNRARRTMGMEAGDAVRYAFSSVGMALTTTTLVLVAGFSVLAQSGFLPNSGMAQLTVITIIIALILDFLLVPPLLIWLDGDRVSKALETVEQKA